MLISLVAMVPLWLRLGLLAGILAAWASGRKKERVRKKREIVDSWGPPVDMGHTEIHSPVDIVLSFNSPACVHVNGEMRGQLLSVTVDEWEAGKPSVLTVTIVFEYGSLMARRVITYDWIESLQTVGLSLDDLQVSGMWG